jgi:hypothetical protein
VEASATEPHSETFPQASIVHLDFPATSSRPAIKMSWYDGGLKPPRPAGTTPIDERKFGPRGEGVLYVGDKGYILAGFNGEEPRVYPESGKYETPPPTPEPAFDPAIEQWVAAIKGGPPAPANFELQNPVTEAFLLGCLAQRYAGKRLEWDTAAGRVTNFEEANRYIDPPYRSGFGA